MRGSRSVLHLFFSDKCAYILVCDASALAAAPEKSAIQFSPSVQPGNLQLDTMPFCPQCGEKSDGGAFCVKCGANLGTPVAVASPPVAVAQPATATAYAMVA